MGGRLLHFFRLLPSFLLLWLAGCRGADASYLQVVVNLQGASVLDSSLLPSVYASSLSQMDNSDVDVRICPAEMFSPDHGGVCGPCATCHAEQYIAAQCLPWQDRVCSNCTVCGWHEVELCSCDLIDSRCFTGDRICVKLVPAALNLTIYMRSAKVLTSVQQNFIVSGLEIWYTDWLVAMFDIESASFLNFDYRGNYTYAAVFEVLGVYDPGTLAQLQAGILSQFQQGFSYSFGLHRRRLLFSPLTDMYVNGAGTVCALPENTCSNVTIFTLSDDSCRAMCMPDPCPVGFFGVYGKCFPCAEGTYKANVTDGNCTACPGNMTSPAEAKSISECFVPTTAAAPIATTADSTTTTAAPVISSAAPVTSSAAPTTTTAAPTTTTAVPTTSSAAPTSTSSAVPTTSSAAPTSTSSAVPTTSTAAAVAATSTFATSIRTVATTAPFAFSTAAPLLTTTQAAAPPPTFPQTATVAPPSAAPPTTTPAPAAPAAASGSWLDSSIMLIAVWGTLGVTVVALCCFGICFACLFALVVRRLAPRHASALESHFFDSGEPDEIIGFDVEARPVIRCRLDVQ